jgi:hypothetical protein
MRRSVVGLGLALFACSDADRAAADTEVATGSGDPTLGVGDGSEASSAGHATSADDGTTTAGGDDSSSGGPPGGPPTLTRVDETFEIATLAASMPKRFVDAAHDPADDVYLVVNGNAAVSGAFIDADGAALAEPFAIADTDAWTQGVRVARGDGFLVAWHDNRDDPASARLRARQVRWESGAPSLGADVEIGTGATYSEMPPAIAWSATSGVHLVAWHTAVGDDIHAQRVQPDGTRVGGEIVITSDPDWQSDVWLAWNPNADEWLAAYTHAGATTEVRVRRIAADGSLPAPEVSLTTAAGTWLAQAAYVPESGEYLVAWFQGEIVARRVAEDGTPIGESFVLAPGYGSYDGFAMAWSPVTATFAATFHGTSDEDFAVAFDASGVQSTVIEATFSRGDDGNFNPRIVANESRAEWLIVTSRGFATVVGQRVGP